MQSRLGGNLPIRLRNLIHARSVEDNRREFKAAWNESTRDSVVRTVCAFANDLLNLNGGYVIIGIETDENRQPVLPPRGLEDADLDVIQREIRGSATVSTLRTSHCCSPRFTKTSRSWWSGRPTATRGPTKRRREAGGRAYYVRSGSETVEAAGAFRTQLFEQAARVPFDAVREAVVNAVYHRSYQSYEPTKVYIYPDRMTITSYPGPVNGIELGHFASDGAIPSVPARNRKVGELLKELDLAESRGTGLPKMRQDMASNGSPEPRFDFDAGRTYFTVTLPAHPRFV